MPVRLHDSRIQFTPEGYLMKRLVGILSAAAITAVCSTAFAQAPAAPETNAAMARDAQNPGGAPTGPRVRAGAKPETNADMARDAQNPGGAPTGPRVRAGAQPETNADMARDAEPTQKRVKRADRKAKAPKKRRAAPATRPETNADIARDAQKQ